MGTIFHVLHPFSDCLESHLKSNLFGAAAWLGTVFPNETVHARTARIRPEGPSHVGVATLEPTTACGLSGPRRGQHEGIYLMTQGPTKEQGFFFLDYIINS